MPITQKILKKMNKAKREDLDLSHDTIADNVIDDKDTIQLARLLTLRKYAHIQEVNVSDNKIKDEGAKRLLSLQLYRLVLANNPITDTSIIKSASSMRITELYLSNTAITVTALVALLSNKYLKKLTLHNCAITHAQLLSTQFLTNTSLTHLTIGGDEIKDNGLENLLRALPNLEFLTVFGNGITDKGVTAILKTLPKLSGLYLTSNQITDEPFKALQNSHLTLLDLESTRLSPAILHYIANSASLSTVHLPQSLLTYKQNSKLSSQLRQTESLPRNFDWLYESLQASQSQPKVTNSHNLFSRSLTQEPSTDDISDSDVELASPDDKMDCTP